MRTVEAIAAVFVVISIGVNCANLENYFANENEIKTASTATCNTNDDCKSTQKCVRNRNGQAFCICKAGRSGDNCETVDACLTGKYKTCKGTNGRCTYDDEKETTECDCGVGKKWDSDFVMKRCRETCKDDCANSGKCEGEDDVKFCRCKAGTGHDHCEYVYDCDWANICGRSKDVKCVYDERTEKGICLCDNSTKFFDYDKKECRVPCNDDCQNSGKCEYVRGNRFCLCKKGTSGDRCETVDDCKKENFCGMNTDVKCVYDESKEIATCQCDKPNKSFDTKLKQCQMLCNSTDDCRSFEKCTQLSSGEKFCRCPPGKSGEQCDTIDDCLTGHLKYCNGDNGRCIYNAEKESADCDCGVGKKWDISQYSCRTTCKDNCANDGVCKDQGNAKFCRCQPGTGGDLCESVHVCETNMCGYSMDVKCVYDKSIKKGKCVCDNSTKLFHYDKKKCQVPCKDDCRNNGKCEYVRRIRFCWCKPGTSGDFCETVTDCTKENFCGMKTDVKCVYDETKERSTCKCDDPNKSFDSTAKECRIPCRTNHDCQIFETCTQLPAGDKFCHCPPGKSGERCEIITDCMRIYKSCKGDSGRCFYDKKSGKASCDCGVGRVFVHWKNKYICRTICKDNCVNKGKCKLYGASNFCECKPGTSGDFCEKVNDCGDRQLCGDDKDVKCVYDESIEGGKCECDNSAKLFDYDATNCRVPCHDDCHNGAKCEYVRGFRFCSCKRGTSGDRCETIEDCTKENFCGKKADVKCVYDKINEIATCKCDDPKKSFDSYQKECRIICKYGCSNNGKCEGEGEAKFCRCKPGISGDLCTVVDHCANQDVCGTKADVQCVYDERKEEVVCKCDDPKKSFDPKTKECRGYICSNYTCQNGGICNYDDGGIPRCYCNVPFTGEMCEKDPCTDNPCKNGGNCEIKRNTYNCICKDHFYGNSCEMDNFFISPSILVLLALIFIALLFILTCNGCCLLKINQKFKAVLQNSITNKTPYGLP